MQTHQALHTFGVGAHAVFMPESSPYAAVASKRMLHFKGLNHRQEFGITLKLNMACSTPAAYQPFFLFQRQLVSGLFKLLVLCRTTVFTTVCRASFECLGGIGQKGISPAVVHTISDLKFTANACHRAPLQSFNHNAGFTFTVPDTAFHFPPGLEENYLNRAALLMEGSIGNALLRLDF